MTGLVSRLVMAYFDRRYLAKLSSIGIYPLMYKRYVDDLNIAIYSLEPCHRFIDGVMMIVEEEIDNDK